MPVSSLRLQTFKIRIVQYTDERLIASALENDPTLTELLEWFLTN